MAGPAEDRDDDGGRAGLVRRTARWAWERDEVDQRVGPQKIAYDAVLYGSMFLVCLGGGGLLWLLGREVEAMTLWLAGNGMAVFFGVIAIGWDILEYREARRSGDEDDVDGPDRDLAPDLTLSSDAKFSFLITVLLLLLLTVAVLLLESIA